MAGLGMTTSQRCRMSGRGVASHVVVAWLFLECHRGTERVGLSPWVVRNRPVGVGLSRRSVTSRWVLSRLVSTAGSGLVRPVTEIRTALVSISGWL